VKLELRSVLEPFRRRGWSRAFGSSGTVKAPGEISRALGLTDGGITPAALETIIDEMVAARRVAEHALPRARYRAAAERARRSARGAGHRPARAERRRAA